MHGGLGKSHRFAAKHDQSLDLGILQRKAVAEDREGITVDRDETGGRVAESFAQDGAQDDAEDPAPEAAQGLRLITVGFKVA